MNSNRSSGAERKMLRRDVEPERRRSLLRNAYLERQDQRAEGDVAEDELLLGAPVAAAGSSERERRWARADLGRGGTAEIDQPGALGCDAVVGKRARGADEQ